MQGATSFLFQIAVVTLIAVAIRWLLVAKGATRPRTRDGASVYGIKRQWRAAGLGGATFWFAISIWESHDLHSGPDSILLGIMIAFVSMGVWLASGFVIVSCSLHHATSLSPNSFALVFPNWFLLRNSSHSLTAASTVTPVRTGLPPAAPAASSQVPWRWSAPLTTSGCAGFSCAAPLGTGTAPTMDSRTGDGSPWHDRW